MYNNRYVTELSISEVKEYYEILRENRELTHEEIADYGICKERLIDYAYKNIGKAESKEQESVLDKIRAEIELNAYPIVHGVNNHEKGMTLYGILQVIDKYRTESEE